MTSIEIYELAMCCSTGVCRPHKNSRQRRTWRRITMPYMKIRSIWAEPLMSKKWLHRKVSRLWWIFEKKPRSAHQLMPT
ncbi:arsenic metallochaperone ArsD family protein [Paenibacillus sp. 843]|uniref:arsenic metallochaperone ArsD family protein n=1 Tax=Paenibacillus sp. 843 TaxID=3341795 RepID=UPI0037276458